MGYKWIGAVLIVVGCGGFGFCLCAEHRKQESGLRELIAILDYMACELQYHMTPLPELCHTVARESGGILGQLFFALSVQLEQSTNTDVASAMESALAKAGYLPDKTRDNLLLLGRSMGRFDLTGQLSSLEAVRGSCRKDLETYSSGREVRLRNYQTLGLCAGAALAIILI